MIFSREIDLWSLTAGINIKFISVFFCFFRESLITQLSKTNRCPLKLIKKLNHCSFTGFMLLFELAAAIEQRLGPADIKLKSQLSCSQVCQQKLL